MTGGETMAKTCGILMATYDDWRSVAHILPLIDKVLVSRDLIGHVIVVDDSSRHQDGKELIVDLPLTAIRTIDEIELGSNQGNQRALAVGLGYIAKNCKFDFLVVMDSDNEDKPDDLPLLFDTCKTHNFENIIFAERAKRSEGIVFSLFYSIYKFLFKMLTGSSISMGNFCIIPWRHIKRIAHISQLWSHFPASIMRSGLPYAKIPTERGKRVFGTGKMNLVRLIIHAFSGFTIHADVIAVRIILVASALVLLFPVALVVLTLVRFGTDFLVPGWTSQMLMEIFLLASMAMCTAVIVLILVLSMRMQPPMTPFHDHMRFVFEVVRLRSAVATAADTSPAPSPVDAVEAV